MKVINFFGGPGSGKSTTAAGLFNLMKLRGHKVELVTEYAKELTYAKDWGALLNQDDVSEEQYRRQLIIKNEVDYCVTDSPLLLGKLYGNIKTFHIEEEFNSFDNINFFIKRTKPYSFYGRKETPEQAIELDQRIRKLLDEYRYDIILGNEDAHIMIYNIIFNNYKISLIDK